MKIFLQTLLSVTLSFSAHAVINPPIISKKNPDPQAIEKAYTLYLKTYFNNPKDLSLYVSHHCTVNPFTGKMPALKSTTLFEVWQNKVVSAKTQEDFLLIFSEISYSIHDVSSWAIKKSLNSAQRWLDYRNGVESECLSQSLDTLSLQESQTSASVKKSSNNVNTGNLLLSGLQTEDDLNDALGFNLENFLTPPSKAPQIKRAGNHPGSFRKKSYDPQKYAPEVGSFFTPPTKNTASKHSQKRKGPDLDQMDLE